MQPIDILSFACAAGALLGAAAYVYGFIIRSKGDRRLHTASLLFSGFGLANLPALLKSGANGPALFNAVVVVVFMLAGMLCQAAAALRGRKADRRAPRPTQAMGGMETAAPSS